MPLTGITPSPTQCFCDPTICRFGRAARQAAPKKGGVEPPQSKAFGVARTVFLRLNAHERSDLKAGTNCRLKAELQTLAHKPCQAQEPRAAALYERMLLAAACIFSRPVLATVIGSCFQ